jgi:hypothetical protein
MAVPPVQSALCVAALAWSVGIAWALGGVAWGWAVALAAAGPVVVVVVVVHDAWLRGRERRAWRSGQRW